MFPTPDRYTRYASRAPHRHSEQVLRKHGLVIYRAGFDRNVEQQAGADYGPETCAHQTFQSVRYRAVLKATHCREPTAQEHLRQRLARKGQLVCKIPMTYPARKRAFCVRHMNDPTSARLEYTMHFIDQPDEFVLGEMFDQVEGHYHVLRDIGRFSKCIHYATLADAWDAQAPGGVHLFGGAIHAACIGVTGLPEGIQQGAVTATQLENDGSLSVGKCRRII